MRRRLGEGRSGALCTAVRVPTDLDLGEQLSHALVCPVTAQHVGHVAHDITLGDGAIDIRHYNLGVGAPQEDLGGDSH